MKLTVIGIGGYGCNAVRGLCVKGMDDAFLVMVDKESELAKNSCPEKKIMVEAGEPTMDERLRELVASSPTVLVVAGMGGRYSIGVVEVLCRVHRQVHGGQGRVCLLAVMPFSFEGRDKRAADNLRRARAVATEVVTFDNNDISQYSDRPLNEAFALTGQKVRELIACIQSQSQV